MSNRLVASGRAWVTFAVVIVSIPVLSAALTLAVDGRLLTSGVLCVGVGVTLLAIAIARTEAAPRPRRLGAGATAIVIGTAIWVSLPAPRPIRDWTDVVVFGASLVLGVFAGLVWPQSWRRVVSVASALSNSG